MIVSVGDLHLQSLRPWSIETGRRVVRDLIESPLNNKNNVLILLGDLTELAVLDGEVFALLMELFCNLNYKQVYVLRGNHDGKVVDGRVVATFDFIKERPGLFTSPVTIVEEPRILSSIEGLKCMFLPHLFGETPEHNLDIYEKRFPAAELEKDVDVIFGHFTNQMRSEPGRKYNVQWMVDRWPEAKWCFGHNHNPGPGYQGSHIPNTISEANKDRQVRTYEKVGAEVVETILPATRILDYYNVRFPEALPAVDAEIPVWTIYECEDEAVARSVYGNIYIRRCIYDLALDSASYDRQSMSVTLKSGEQVSVTDLFNAWKKLAQLDPELDAETTSYLPLAHT